MRRFWRATTLELLVPKERLRRLDGMPVDDWTVVIGAAILTTEVVVAPKAKLTVMVLGPLILTVQELVAIDVQPVHEAMCEPA